VPHSLYSAVVERPLALGLVFATVATAQAKDLCINIPNFFGPNAPLVGKKFRVPPKNQCKPFNGFTPSSVPFFVVGTGCMSPDGFTFYLAFTGHSGQGASAVVNTVTGACGFNAPTMNGGCVLTSTVADYPADELFSFSFTATGQTCTVNVP
jgi:hypothetical protein